MKDREKQIEELKSLMLEKSNSANVEPVFTDDDGKEHTLPDEAIKVLNDILEQAFIPFLAEVVIDSGYGNIEQAQKETIKEIVSFLTQFEGFANIAGEEIAKKYGIEE